MTIDVEKLKVEAQQLWSEERNLNREIGELVERRDEVSRRARAAQALVEAAERYAAGEAVPEIPL